MTFSLVTSYNGYNTDYSASALWGFGCQCYNVRITILTILLAHHGVFDVTM